MYVPKFINANKMMWLNQGGQSGIYVLLQNKHRSWEHNDEEKSSRGDVKEKLFSQEKNI